MNFHNLAIKACLSIFFGKLWNSKVYKAGVNELCKIALTAFFWEKFKLLNIETHPNKIKNFEKYLINRKTYNKTIAASQLDNIKDK